MYMYVDDSYNQFLNGTVHILQFDTAGTDSLPQEGNFLWDNPNLLLGNLAVPLETNLIQLLKICMAPD